MADFLINYEHKTRELDSVCLIKAELVRRGYTVDISCTYDEDRTEQVQRKDAKVVLTSALYDEACLDYFVYSIAGFCRKVVNLQWEQVLTNEDESHPSYYQNPKGFAKEALHLCWGDETRNRLMRAGVSSKNALVVGPVQMDTLRPEFDEIYLSKNDLAEIYDLNPDRDWVLFISSFSFANLSEDEYNLIRKSYGDRIIDFKNISIISKQKIIEWLLLALVEYPSKIFIYRPHPSENQDEVLLNIAKTYPNFHIIRDLTIKQWIKCSDKILTWYSTAAAEVYFSGKHCSILRPVSIPHNWEVSIYNNATVISSVDEFIKNIEINNSQFPLDVNIFNKYYHEKDEIPSYMKICDVLENVINTDDFLMKKNWNMFTLRAHITRVRNNSAFILKKLLEKTNYRSFLLGIKPLIAKFENHLAAMNRLRNNREKSQASEAEFAELNLKIQRIVYAIQRR